MESREGRGGARREGRGPEGSAALPPAAPRGKASRPGGGVWGRGPERGSCCSRGGALPFSTPPAPPCREGNKESEGVSLTLRLQARVRRADLLQTRRWPSSRPGSLRDRVAPPSELRAPPGNCPPKLWKGKGFPSAPADLQL